ncbi:MAG: hypothetical protein E5V17_06510, partial [Mesorhizobium sp.]
MSTPRWSCGPRQIPPQSGRSEAIQPKQSPPELILMTLSFRRASLASLGLAFGLSALSLSPVM